MRNHKVIRFAVLGLAALVLIAPVAIIVSWVDSAGAAVGTQVGSVDVLTNGTLAGRAGRLNFTNGTVSMSGNTATIVSSGGSNFSSVTDISISGKRIQPSVVLPGHLYFDGQYQVQKTNAITGPMAILLTNIASDVVYVLKVDATGSTAADLVVTFTGFSSPGNADTNGLTTYLIERDGSTTNITRIVGDTVLTDEFAARGVLQRRILGAGNGNTNYTLSATYPAMVAGSSNINIVASMPASDSRVHRWSLTLTNDSTSDWGFKWSQVTNRCLYAGPYGTNAPVVFTNNTRIRLDVEQTSTNCDVFWTTLSPAK